MNESELVAELVEAYAVNTAEWDRVVAATRRKRPGPPEAWPR